MVERRETVPSNLPVAIAREFDRLPRLAVTPAQARRLWALDEETCASVLGDLRSAGILRLRGDGRFERGSARVGA